LQEEGLLDDQDFRLQVTREEFEAMCSDLFDRVKGPINQALRSSGLTLDVINHVSSIDCLIMYADSVQMLDF